MPSKRTKDTKEQFSGYGLHHFRDHKDIRQDVYGKRSKRIKYSVLGFTFKNLTQSKASIEDTLIATVDDFTKEIVDSMDVQGKNIVLVLTHSGLRESDKSLFISLHTAMSPGSSLLALIQRYAQSNSNMKLQDEMDIDFFVTN